MRGVILLLVIFASGLFAGETNKTIIKVLGIKNKSCVEKITQEIKKIDGVEKVEVDIESGQVTIDHENVDVKYINSAISDAGYKSASKKSAKLPGVETDETHCSEKQETGCYKPCSNKR